MRSQALPGDSSMTTPINKDHVARLSEELGEPGWLAERRIEAWDLFEKHDLPDPKSEEWRYTDVRGFDFDRFRGPEPRFSAPELAPDLQGRGVVAVDFTVAASRYADLLRSHFFTDVPVDEHKFTALHGALHSDGVLFYVPAGVEVEVPLQVMRRVDEGGSTFPHTTVVVDENAALTLVDVFSSAESE